MLRSSAEDDDGQPFSKPNAGGPRDEDLRSELVPDPHTSKTVAIPLSHVIQAVDGGESGAIRVENGWDIEYSDRVHPRNNM